MKHAIHEKIQRWYSTAWRCFPEQASERHSTLTSSPRPQGSGSRGRCQVTPPTLQSPGSLDISLHPDRISRAVTPKAAHLGFPRGKWVGNKKCTSKARITGVWGPRLGFGLLHLPSVRLCRTLHFSGRCPSKDSPPLVGPGVGLEREPLEKEPHGEAGAQRPADIGVFPVSSWPCSHRWVVISWQFYVPTTLVRISTCRASYNWL